MLTSARAWVCVCVSLLSVCLIREKDVEFSSQKTRNKREEQN